MSYVIFSLFHINCHYTQLLKPTAFFKIGQISSRCISSALKKPFTLRTQNTQPKLCAKYYQTNYHENLYSFKWFGQSVLLFFSCAGIGLFLWKQEIASCNHNSNTEVCQICIQY